MKYEYYIKLNISYSNYTFDTKLKQPEFKHTIQFKNIG